MKPILMIASLFIASSLSAQDLRIVVYKSERRLDVYQHSTLVHRFRIGLGNTPVGDKEKAGDGKTPEGTFYVCVKNPKSRFYLSLGISYPDADDAARGLRDQLITREDHDRIVEAQRKKGIPPWNTALGGEVFIHGRGAHSDWTLGCVALEDADMKMLYDLIEVGTQVEIKP
ncbi:MAG: murein L,D-transpeptidase family protein [Candidatus Methylacidiphilales bacterium]